MRTLTTATLERYAAAAAALAPDTLHTAMRLTERYAAHTDDAADALPFAVIALADAAATGKRLAPEVAVTVALTGARRQRERDQHTAPPVDVSTLPDTATPATPAASAPRLEDVLPTLPAADAALLSGLAARGVARVFAERVKSRRTLPNGTPVGDAMHDVIPMTRRALRVGDVAAAVGAPTPRTRAASDTMRATACVAWSRASLALGTAHTGETLETRAARAMRYVTTDPRALAAAWRRERDLIGSAPLFAGTSTPDTLRRLGWQAPVSGASAVVMLPVPSTSPDTAAWWTAAPARQYPHLSAAVSGGSVTRSMPLPSKGAPSRSRKGLVTASTSTRHAAVSEGMAHGSVVAGESVDGGVRALAAAARRQARDDAAYAAHAARMDAGAGVCHRPDALGYPLALGYAARCGCGGSTAPLVMRWVIPATDPTGAPVPDYRHRLTACAAPVETRDDAGTLTGHKCGCGSKRGVLVRQDDVWCHPRRVK